MLLGIRWGSLRAKIIAWSFVPTAIILGAVALVTYIAYQQVTELLVMERNRELTRLAANQLAASLRERAELLANEGRRSEIYATSPAVKRDGLRQASNRLAVFDGGVLLLDTFGTVEAAEPERPEILGEDWSDRSYYRQVLESVILGSGGTAVSDIVTDGPGGVNTIALAVPVTSSRGEFMGVLVGMFRVGVSSVSTLYGDIVKLRLGEGSGAYIVDGSGRLIYHSDPARVADDVSNLLVVRQALDGLTGAIRTRDFQNHDIVASFAPVPGTAWGLVTQERWSKLLSASQSYQGFLLVLLALGLVVPAIVVAVGIRHVTKPITDLTRAARQVAGGQFGQTISAPTGDELEELADQFNRMSAQLKESYASLEQRVAVRTRELAALNAIATVVSQSLNLDEILDDALNTTLEVMELEAGGIYLLDEQADTLTLASHQGFGPEFADDIDRLRVGEGFSGRVVQSGEPLVVKDASSDPRLTRMVVKSEGLRSLMVVPLSAKGKVLGTLFAMTHGYREFTDQDLQLLTSIGHQIGVAVDSVRLFQAEQRRAEQFRVITEVGHRITSILAVDELLDHMAGLISEAFGYYGVGIGLVDGNYVDFKAGAGAFRKVIQTHVPLRLEVGKEGLTGWVAATGEPLVVPDVSQDPRYYYVPEVGYTRSELCVPLQAKGVIIGVLIAQSERLNAFGATDLAILQALANQAAIAIENARLYQQAQQLAVMEERQRLARELHDAVTQTLFSASLIAEALPELWESDQEEGQELLRELRQLNRGALAEMRTLLLELRPAALVEASLEDLLRQLGEAATGRTGTPVQVVVEDEVGLPPDVHVALYRIAQEALNNVVKHARACHVGVHMCQTLSPADDGTGQEVRVELQVRDDGCGFDPSSIPSDRLGLGIIRERAEAIGARLAVESQRGHGTRIAVLWQGPAPTLKTGRA